MKRQHKKLIFIAGGLVVVGLAVTMILYGLKDEVSVFKSPSELSEMKSDGVQKIRIGGYVLEGSLKHDPQDESLIHFTITDYQNEIEVYYKGLLPDLFREGQGVIADGTLQENGTFKADVILAKHDENYIPPELSGFDKP